MNTMIRVRVATSLLFAATSTSMADPANVCLLRYPPTDSGTSHAQTPRAQADRLIWTWRPPARYDGPFTGSLVVKYLSDDQIRENCAPGSLACTYRFHIEDVLCVMFLPSDESLKARGIEPREVYRHEIEHRNGWPGDHGGTFWERKAAGDHRFHRMDIRAPRCLNMGAISSWSNGHEKVQYAWDYRWCRVFGRGTLLASMVARQCGFGATANGVTC